MKNNLLDTAENALLEILKREITGLDRTEKTELSVAGLKTVMRLAKEHAVMGLVANAAVRNRIVIAGGAAEGRGEAVMKLMQLTMVHRQVMQRFENAVGRFARLMKEHNIAYVVFKGLAVARHYPEPFVRTMGDVDFYVPKRCFDRAVEVIASVEPSVLLILQPVTPMNGVPGAEPGYMLELQQRALAKLPDVRVIPQTHRMMNQL